MRNITTPITETLVPVIDISVPFREQMNAQPLVWVRPNVAAFKVVWGDIIPPFPLEVGIGGIDGVPPGTAGVWDGKVMKVASWGKANARHHRGGFGGTVIHEFAHLLQSFGANNSYGDWYYTNHHDEQSHLFEKWESVLSPFYAGSHEAESTAEVFRVLKGYRSKEEWENNSQLLKEWEDFLRRNEVFKHFFP